MIKLIKIDYERCLPFCSSGCWGFKGNNIVLNNKITPSWVY